jgi:hypothetical protein
MILGAEGRTLPEHFPDDKVIVQKSKKKDENSNAIGHAFHQK